MTSCGVLRKIGANQDCFLDSLAAGLMLKCQKRRPGWVAFFVGGEKSGPAFGGVAIPPAIPHYKKARAGVGGAKIFP
jgi:hypothetical protein